jgi:hypothetical protein
MPVRIGQEVQDVPRSRRRPLTDWLLAAGRTKVQRGARPALLQGLEPEGQSLRSRSDLQVCGHFDCARRRTLSSYGNEPGRRGNARPTRLASALAASNDATKSAADRLVEPAVQLADRAAAGEHLGDGQGQHRGPFGGIRKARRRGYRAQTADQPPETRELVQDRWCLRVTFTEQARLHRERSGHGRWHPREEGWPAVDGGADQERRGSIWHGVENGHGSAPRK